MPNEQGVILSDTDWAAHLGMSEIQFLELLAHVRAARRIVRQHSIRGEFFLEGVTFNRPLPQLSEQAATNIADKILLEIGDQLCENPAFEGAHFNVGPIIKILQYHFQQAQPATEGK